jgi:hypothetical protein
MTYQLKNRFQSLPFKCKPAALHQGGWLLHAQGQRWAVQVGSIFERRLVSILEPTGFKMCLQMQLVPLHSGSAFMNELEALRSKPPKFICLNDDLNSTDPDPYVMRAGLGTSHVIQSRTRVMGWHFSRHSVQNSGYGLALFTLFSPELGLWVGTFHVILQPTH